MEKLENLKDLKTLKTLGYQYAKSVIDNKISAPKYVKLQCREFIKIYESESDNNFQYFLNHKKLKQIESILKFLIMPRGLKSGKSIYDCSCGYQWLFYESVLCVVHKENPNKRRYETAILEVGRKNFKTFTIATIFILLFLLEPKFSKFYSVAPDGALSREVKTAIEEILKSSPLVYYKNYNNSNNSDNLKCENKQNNETAISKLKNRFKILRDYIECNLNNNRYIPLNYSNSRLDGKLPNVFLADEVGALPNSYAIESMRSGQLNILNKLGCIISTKYSSMNNPFENEISYAKKVLDKIEKDETLFALLYEPDDIENWTTNDNILIHANPVALEINEIWEDLKKKRARALICESARENFLTKHCNIIYQGAGTESFIDIKDLINCRINKIDWNERQVYVGVDLSITTDNTAVAMVAEEDNKILAKVFCFIPEGRIEEKSKFERLDYFSLIQNKKIDYEKRKEEIRNKESECFACGNKTIDYSFIEDFVFNLEKIYGVTIKAIGFDRYNCLSSAQKWNQKYNTIEIRQHSDTLHPATKLLSEKIINGEFVYEKNKLLEINFENARCVYDTNLNRYVTKKRSNGKVDMIMALINAVYLLQKDVIFSDGFVFQII
ncbi:MAG: terminase [Candidatus Improbicoccus pseudotrichonymphae]|uniref:Terminase n=1 Tax=Candidatus Improbicoccus pseudotrichonymphae TaxID=3033792 RepID=A0AA48KVL0_9FIRM|nr:MAG: terminase [Candidatus Improbicoccus pseudotrichonymphae]